jgi:hypothetical protein
MAVASGRKPLTIASLLSAVYLVGCGRQFADPAPPEPLNPVSGIVKYKGKPAAGVRVYLSRISGAPEETSLPVSCTTLTDEQGEFTCPTYLTLNGLPTGKYIVLFTWPDTPSLEPIDNETDRLSGKYSQQSNPQFAVVIKPGENKLPPFDLK